MHYLEMGNTKLEATQASLQKIPCGVPDLASMSHELIRTAEVGCKVSEEIHRSSSKLDVISARTVKVTHESFKGVDVLTVLSKVLD